MVENSEFGNFLKSKDVNDYLDQCVIAISTYPKEQKQVRELQECINHCKKLKEYSGVKIALFTHYPITDMDVYKDVDYVIYDSDNDIINTYGNTVSFAFSTVYDDGVPYMWETTLNHAVLSYHSYTILKHFKNLHGLMNTVDSYRNLIFIEADHYLNEENWTRFLKLVIQYKKNLVFTIYPNDMESAWHKKGCITGLFALTREYLSALYYKHFSKINNSKQYMEYCDSNDIQANTLETFFKYCYSDLFGYHNCYAIEDEDLSTTLYGSVFDGSIIYRSESVYNQELKTDPYCEITKDNDDYNNLYIIFGKIFLVKTFDHDYRIILDTGDGNNILNWKFVKGYDSVFFKKIPFHDSYRIRVIKYKNENDEDISETIQDELCTYTDIVNKFSRRIK